MRLLGWTLMVAGFVLIILGVTGLLAQVNPKQNDASSVRQKLLDDYGHYNDGYFDGSLPRDVSFAYYPDETGDIGDTFCDFGGPCSIYINSYFDRDRHTADMTELHEMCHDWVELKEGGEVENGGHGPKWNACMHRLADEGAMDNLW